MPALVRRLGQAGGSARDSQTAGLQGQASAKKDLFKVTMSQCLRNISATCTAVVVVDTCEKVSKIQKIVAFGVAHSTRRPGVASSRVVAARFTAICRARREVRRTVGS